VYVTGRIKRIVMTKGDDGNVTKLFPDRIENVLSEHPAISLCCVVGIKDDVRIHYPKAFVVLYGGYSANNKLTEEIRAFCKDKLPGYMIPDEIEYLPDLPRTSRGKIDYRALEKQAEEMSKT
ncbi:MAG: acyl--CoA ligase, partial [Clostridia bacterium]|nr:acyl--CoA ligase [Clostridia bacterium]